jgi:hypothetical protein
VRPPGSSPVASGYFGQSQLPAVGWLFGQSQLAALID